MAIQYADYAVWQREWLQGEVLEGQLGYWREQLGGAPAVLELPTDKPRPAVQSYRGATRAVSVERGVDSRAEGVEPARRGDAVHDVAGGVPGAAVALQRAGDVVVGTPIAERTRAEMEGLIGFFVNTLVLRAEVGGAASFAELLRRGAGGVSGSVCASGRAV